VSGAALRAVVNNAGPAPAGDDAPEAVKPNTITRPVPRALMPQTVEPQGDEGGTAQAAQAQSKPQSQSQSQSQAPAAQRVLRMLSGPNTGAESILRGDRLLIGNLESECDVVIDVSRQERHICLVRASDDGWTVLSIAGDLWVGDSYIEAQHTFDIASGTVLTLGRVAFCVADTASIDWAAVSIQHNLSKPEAAGPVPVAVLPPASPNKLHKWHAMKLACGIGVAALTMASAGAYLTSAWNLRVPTAEEGAARIKAHQSLVTALPFGKELLVQPLMDSAAPQRELIRGYLPQREQARALEKALKDAEVDADVRITAVDELAGEVTRRMDRIKSNQVHYDNQGRFVVDTNTTTLDQHDRQARQTLQEVPLVNGVSLNVQDLLDNTGKAVVVRYERSVERPGDIVVSDLDVVRQRMNFVVKEKRLGQVPSIVLDNNIRYFEGAVLPDGSVLKRIAENELLVTQGRGERIIPLVSEDTKPAPTPTPTRPGSSPP
jgi:hypothetical protein